jgi:O-acetylserine/cysteine efflux transporter
MVIGSAAAWGLANVIAKAAQNRRPCSASSAGPASPRRCRCLLSMLFEGTSFALPDHVPSMTAVLSIAFLAYPTTVFNFAAWIFLLRNHRRRR